MAQRQKARKSVPMDLATYLPATATALQRLQNDSSLQLAKEELEEIIRRTPKFLQHYNVDNGAAQYMQQLAQLFVQYRDARKDFPKTVPAIIELFDSAIVNGRTPEELKLLDAEVAGGIMGIYFVLRNQRHQQPAAEKQTPANETPVKAASRFKNLESICNLGYRIGSVELANETLRIAINEPESSLDADSVKQDFLAATQPFCRLSVSYEGRTVTLSPTDDRRSRNRALRFLEAYRDTLVQATKA